MRIICRWERDTSNFRLYKWKDGNREHSLYLPLHIVKNPVHNEIAIIKSHHNLPNPNIEELDMLRRENAELKRRMNAIRNLV